MRLIALILLCVPFAFGSIYHVKNGGSDGADGLSDATAWASCVKVNGFAFSPGDSILFRRGDLWRDSLVIGYSGTAASPIFYGAYGTGPKPIFNGANVTTGWSLVSGNIYSTTTPYAARVVVEDDSLLTYVLWDTDVSTTFSGASAGSFSTDGTTVYAWCSDEADPDMHTMDVAYSSDANTGAVVFCMDKDFITIDNLDIRNTAYRSIFVRLLSTDRAGIQVTNCTIRNAGETGIQFQGSGNPPSLRWCVARYDTIFDCRNHGIWLGYSAKRCTVANNLIYRTAWDLPLGYHGISGWTEDYAYAPDSNVIEYNHVWGVHAVTGGAPEGTGIQFDNEVRNTIVRYNLVHDNEGTGIYANYGYGNSIYYNVVYNNGTVANGLGGITTSVETSMVIRNNTVFRNHGVGVKIGDYNSGVTVQNNILADNVEYEIVCWDGTVFSTLSSDYNCVWHPAGGNFMWYPGHYATWSEWLGTGQDAHSINVYPAFVDSTARNLALSSGSGAINTGYNWSQTQDYAGSPVVGTPDIGAYEYQTPVSSAPKRLWRRKY